MNLRAFHFSLLLVLALALIPSIHWGQSTGHEAAAADEHGQVKTVPRPAYPSGEKINLRLKKDIGSPIIHAESSPQRPMQDYFWEYVLLIFGLVFLFWVGLLVTGLVVSSSTAAAIFLGLTAATAYLGIVALLIALIALMMIITREERRAKRRQFWRSL